MTQKYVIRINGKWLSEFIFTETHVQPTGSDVKQDAQIFEGMGSVIAGIREVYLWQRLSGVDVYEITIEAV